MARVELHARLLLHALRLLQDFDTESRE